MLFCFLELWSRAERRAAASTKNYFNIYAGVTSEATRHDLNELAKFDKDTTNQVVYSSRVHAILDEYTLRR